MEGCLYVGRGGGWVHWPSPLLTQLSSIWSWCGSPRSEDCWWLSNQHYLLLTFRADINYFPPLDYCHFSGGFKNRDASHSDSALEMGLTLGTFPLLDSSTGQQSMTGVYCPSCVRITHTYFMSSEGKVPNFDVKVTHCVGRCCPWTFSGMTACTYSQQVLLFRKLEILYPDGTVTGTTFKAQNVFITLPELGVCCGNIIVLT